MVGEQVDQEGDVTAVAAELGSGRRGPLVVVLAGLALFLVYVGLSFVNDPRGTLSTDVGGKVATLEVMTEGDGTVSPDVGYWAAAGDPTGTMHGLYYTSLVGGKYVNVTTVPVLELSRPLYAVGGYRLTLVWSMAGAVAAAFAARAIARRAGGDEARGWLAFGLVGLASPALLYALDLWEHAPGLGLMAWGVVAMVDAASSRARWWLGLAAGLLFGLAFSLRTEAVAYGFAVVGVGCVFVWRRQGLVSALARGALAAVGFASMVAANSILEVLVLGESLRGGRASGTAATGGGDALLRLKEALITTVGLVPDLEWKSSVVGGLAMALLGWAVWRSSRPGDRKPAYLAAAGAILLFVIRAGEGVGFVPGFLTTVPFGIVTIVLIGDRRLDERGRLAAVMVLAALPFVWWFQFSGGALPQWGGRYVLLSGLVLGAVGVGLSGAIDRWMRLLLVGLSVSVAVFGLSWMSLRTHEIGRATAVVEGIDGPVVSTVQFWLREMGTGYRSDVPWVTTNGVTDAQSGADLVAESGRDELSLIWMADEPDTAAPELAGWRPVEEQRQVWLDLDFRITEYVRSDSNVRS